MASNGFARPTLADLKTRMKADLLARLSVDEVLRRSDIEVQASVQAAAVHSLYGFIDYVAANVMVDTADGDHLARHASIWGVTRKSAAKSVGSVTFATSVGAVIPIGAELTHAGGQSYLTTEAKTATGATTVVAVQAAESGAVSNLTAGEALSLVSPIAGVQSTATGGEIVGGADIESDASLRARVLDRIQTPPHGGAKADYITWALEVDEVTRAWALPLHSGIGTVGVMFVLDGREDIVPLTADIEAVQAYIDTVRPVTADVTVFAPTPVELDLTIAVTPATAAVKAAIELELQDFIAREAEPGGTIYLSRLREAISLAAGEFNHSLTLPAADVTHAATEIAVLGTITWA
ncbi:baseplate J/gp47 family protein [Hwanghaeella sp.]|uniref:baseplate J/gp47 family protein n=1 Tax=Hwanghaeella sp. TaxID=2605943 RepID=UPI003CCC1B32